MLVPSTKYLAVETTMSGLCNAILNFASAYGLFHRHSHIPATGPGSLLRDSIGETFFVTFLSVLIPSLIARQRRRAGTLPLRKAMPAARAGNLYLRSFLAGLIVTAACVAANAVLLPRIFPDGVSLHNILLFKTVYGTIVGSIATFFALRRSLREVEVAAPVLRSTT